MPRARQQRRRDTLMPHFPALWLIQMGRGPCLRGLKHGCAYFSGGERSDGNAGKAAGTIRWQWGTAAGTVGGSTLRRSQRHISTAFACRYIDGQWRNHESGITVEATVIGWRLPPRVGATRRDLKATLNTPCLNTAWRAAICPKCDGNCRRLRFGTPTERSASGSAAVPYSVVHG